MHEIGFAESIIASATRRAGTRPVSGLRVRAGVRHALDLDSLEQAIQLVGAGTPFQNARLDLVTLPIGINCHTCGVASESMERLPACPACGSVDVDAEGGDELILESLTYADDAADTGASEADVPVPADTAAGR